MKKVQSTESILKLFNCETLLKDLSFLLFSKLLESFIIKNFTKSLHFYFYLFLFVLTFFLIVRADLFFFLMLSIIAIINKKIKKPNGIKNKFINLDITFRSLNWIVKESDYIIIFIKGTKWIKIEMLPFSTHWLASKFEHPLAIKLLCT